MGALTHSTRPPFLLPTILLPGGTRVRDLPVSAGDTGWILPEDPERKWHPLQYSKNPMDGGARWAIVPGVAKSSDTGAAEHEHTQALHSGNQHSALYSRIFFIINIYSLKKVWPHPVLAGGMQALLLGW